MATKRKSAVEPPTDAVAETRRRRRQVRNGAEARQLLDSELLRAAFDRQERDALEAALAASDKGQKLALLHVIQVVRTTRRLLEQLVETGEQAKAWEEQFEGPGRWMV